MLTPPAAAVLLAAIASVRAWTPPAVLAQPAVDYVGRLARYRAAGLLDATDAAALRVLLQRSADRWEFAHGDARPANVLVTEDGRATWRPTGPLSGRSCAASPETVTDGRRLGPGNLAL